VNLVHKMDEGARFDVKVGVDTSRNTNDGGQLGASDGILALDRTIVADSRENGMTSTGKYTLPVGDDHTLAAGWEGGYQRRDEGRIQSDAVLPGYLPDNSDDGYKASVGRLAFFVQDDWAVTPLWSLYAGLRWEGISTRSDGASFAAVRNRASVWSPLLQSLWKLPGMQDQVRVALTRTFKAPTLASLTPRLITSTNNSQSAPDVQGNPNLKPELATGLDTSFDHYLDKDGALLSASASMRRIDNYTRQGLVLQNERWVAMPVNEGNATTRSVELEAKLPLKSLLGATLGTTATTEVPAVDLHASVSRNWSQVDSVPGPDNRLDGQVPLSANLGVDYKTADGALSTGGNFNFRNGGPLRISDTQSAYLTPRRDLDMYALWKIDPKYQLRLALNNLLGQDYQSENSYADTSGTLVRNATYPSSVQARATLEVKF
jgi:outer membrane receptor for ferrienterochelin and colicins